MDSSGANLCTIGSGDWDAYTDPTTVSDTKSNTYAELPGQSVHDSLLGQQSRLFYCPNPTVGSGHQITITRSNLYGSASFEFFSGVAELYPLEAYGGAALGFGNSAIQPGPMSPLQDGSLIFTSVCSPSPGVAIDESFSPPIYVVPTVDSYGEASAYLIQPIAASVNPTWTYPGADGLCATWVVFRPQTESGLEAWWKLDEGTGTTGGDSSGNSNPVTLTGGATWGVGPDGQPCMVLDGANDYAATSFAGPPAYGQLTLAAWINRATVGPGDAQRGGLISKTNGGSWNYELIIGFATDALTFYSDGFFPNQSSSADGLTVAKEWHHVAVVVDVPNVVFYVDGVFAGGYGVSGAMIGNVGEPVLLGNEGDPGTPGTDFFHGKIADARIYTYPLDAAAIAILAARPAPGIGSITPNEDVPAGGTPVTIVGFGFYQVASVLFGGVTATSIIVVDDTTITCVSPAHGPAVVDVVVTNGDAQAASIPFTYAGLTVDAGPDQNIALPNAAQLFGEVVVVPDEALTITWSKQSGPGTVTFGNSSLPTTSAAFSVSGTYVLRLTATDGFLTVYDELTVVVRVADASFSLREGETVKVSLTAIDRRIALFCEQSARYRIFGVPAWLLNSDDLGLVDWPLASRRVVVLTAAAVQTLELFARTATTGTLYILREA